MRFLFFLQNIKITHDSLVTEINYVDIIIKFELLQSSSARDSTPEPPPPQPIKSKKKSKTPVHSHGHLDDDDDDFEVTSKSKAYNRIKSTTKDMPCNGGNILQPR